MTNKYRFFLNLTFIHSFQNIKMNLSNNYFLITLFALSLVCQSCLSDIRTEYVKKEGTISTNLEKGKTLLQNIHTGQSPAAWADIDIYELTLSDEFFGLQGSLAKPFPGKKISMQAFFAPNSYDGKLTFNEGKLKGTTWGIQSWKTYTQESGKQVNFDKNKKIEFWLPTYQYFIELPARVQHANVISYAGEQSFKGQNYDLVYVTWKVQEPQKDIDQYMIWINKETNTVDLVEFTIRDQVNFLTATAVYEDLKDAGDGVLLPKRISIKPNKDKDGILHQIGLSNFKANHIPASTVRPDTNLKTMGDDKAY